MYSEIRELWTWRLSFKISALLHKVTIFFPKLQQFLFVQLCSSLYINDILDKHSISPILNYQCKSKSIAESIDNFHLYSSLYLRLPLRLRIFIVQKTNFYFWQKFNQEVLGIEHRVHNSPATLAFRQVLFFFSVASAARISWNSNFTRVTWHNNRPLGAALDPAYRWTYLWTVCTCRYS